MPVGEKDGDDVSNQDTLYASMEISKWNPPMQLIF
jgi:hypothetical protein